MCVCVCVYKQHGDGGGDEGGVKVQVQGKAGPQGSRNWWSCLAGYCPCAIPWGKRRSWSLPSLLEKHSPFQLKVPGAPKRR